MRVGAEEDEKQFFIHKQLLVAKSGYFKGVLAGSQFKESTTNDVVLRDVESGVFIALVGWMYSGSIVVVSPEHLTATYIMADRFIVPACKDYLLELAVNYFDTNWIPPSHDAITNAFDNLSGNDVYLRMLRDMFCKYSIDIPDEGLSDLPREFVFWVVTLLYRHSKIQIKFLDTDIKHYNSADDAVNNREMRSIGDEDGVGLGGSNGLRNLPPR